jgi:uncharacterized protein YdaT
MLWTSNNYPQQFGFLSSPVREKAVDIGNALIRSNLPPQHAERIAYERAVDWARRSRTTGGRCTEYHVLPYYGSWIVKCSGSNTPICVLLTQEAAIRKACEIARGHMTDIVVHGFDGRIIDRSSFA